MHVEFLVEEPSAEATLDFLVPAILGVNVSFDCRVFQGKTDLLSHLPQRLRGYRFWPPDTRIVVLLDEDREDCLELKARMDRMAVDAGLRTRPSFPTNFQVLNRIAVEEIEAWFLGDVDALVRAFPGLPHTLSQRAQFRNPDAVRGGTAESLERVLKRAGYYRGGLSKIDLARRVAPQMSIAGNRSHSFEVFVSGLRALAGQS